MVQPDRLLSRRTLIVASAAAVAIPARAAPRPERLKNQISLGLTPVFVTSDLELLGRLQSYLEGATGLPVNLVTRRTYQEVTALLLAGALDAAWICGFPFVAHRPELQLVAVPLWHARPLYRSYIIVDSGRGASSLADLRGDVHAFSDPDSNSGFINTAAMLAELRLRPDSFFSRTFFTYGHRNVIRAVASGLAASGSVDGYVFEVLAEIEPALTAKTRILHASQPSGFPPIAAPRVPVDVSRLASLRSALLGMSESPGGRAILAMLRLDGFAIEEPSLYDAIAAKAALVASAG